MKDIMENIDAIVYINLDRRIDRREQFEAEMAKMGITNCMRFQAIETTPGMVGCHSSHLAVLEMAREKKWKNVLIFEDDFMFIIDKDTFHKQITDFYSLDIPYNVLMLSYNLKESEDYNTVVGLVRKAQTASGYIVHSSYYDTIIANLSYNLPLLRDTHQHWLYLNDICWFPIQQEGGWYYMKTRCGIQRPSYSDLGERFVDYGV